MHASLGDATAALAAKLRSFGGMVHVIAHSLGGVITLETFAAASDLPPGRIVLLGSPVQGSQAATFDCELVRWPADSRGARSGGTV